MRDERTPDEQIAINLVTHALEAEGRTVFEDPDITDRPDWVFALDGVRVGAECVCINLERLMAWSNTRRKLEPERCYEVVFPNEPHLWIRKAIEAKEPKIPDYLSNSSAEEIWLIAHSDFTPGMAHYGCDANMLDLMKRAAAAIDSEFDQVWFVHPEAGAHRLWIKGAPSGDFPQLNLEDGYPTLTSKKAIATFTKDGLSVSMGPENTIETIRLPPLDKRYLLGARESKSSGAFPKARTETAPLETPITTRSTSTEPPMMAPDLLLPAALGHQRF